MNRILIIDDDKELCTLIKRSVCAENIEADICNTGREGIQQLKEQEYQLVILDVMMPGMDGVETLKLLRRHVIFERFIFLFIFISCNAGFLRLLIFDCKR